MDLNARMCQIGENVRKIPYLNRTHKQANLFITPRKHSQKRIKWIQKKIRHEYYFNGSWIVFFHSENDALKCVVSSGNEAEVHSEYFCHCSFSCLHCRYCCCCSCCWLQRKKRANVPKRNMILNSLSSHTNFDWKHERT